MNAIVCRTLGSPRMRPNSPRQAVPIDFAPKRAASEHLFSSLKIAGFWNSSRRPRSRRSGEVIFGTVDAFLAGILREVPAGAFT